MDSYYGDGGALIQDPVNALVYYSGGTVVSGSYSVMCVSKSTDGGSTWPYRYNLTADYGYCYAVAVDPTNNNIVYAGGDGGLYKSTNAGTSWGLSSTGITGTIYDIKVNPSGGNLVYAGTVDGVFKSTNAGGNWSDVGCDSVNVLLINPVHPDTIYAGTGYGVFLSTNAGSTWTAMNSGLNNLKIKALTNNPGVYLFCGTAAGCYRCSMAVAVEEGHAFDTPGLGLSVYPNPCHGTAKISIAHRAESIGLQIYDISGRLVFSYTLSSMPFALCWNGTDEKGYSVPAGVYFVKASTGTSTETKSLLLIR